MPSLSRRAALLAPLGLAAAGPAWAQAFPTRPMRMIVAFSAGGSNDVVARIVSQELSRVLNHPVVVENRAGASGNLGADFAAKSPPDGHTLFMGSASTLASNVSLFRNMPYDPVRDFAPITLVGIQPNVIVVHPSVPVRTLPELIAHARANPGRLNFGSAGTGSAQFMAADVFRRMANIDIVHVPYRGGAPAQQDLIAGQIQLMFETIPTAVGPIASGQLRAIAVTTAQRVARLPDLPTVAEQGFSGYESRGWMGVVAPAGTPEPIVALLARHIQAIVNMPEVRTRLEGLGLTVSGAGPAEFHAFIRDEVENYRRIVADAGIEPN
jgi:tripartite-type tricarboxylate transporter receptor subunit TctC